MAQAPQTVNSAVPRIAPLRNVGLLMAQIDVLTERMEGEPGLGCFYGPSGYGKSFAKVFAANKKRAYHVQCNDTWTRKVLCQEILHSMGLAPAGTIPEMVKQVAEQLRLSSRPLIIDEADFLVKKSLIEALRAIYEMCLTPIILIGEADLPKALERWERVYSRVLTWTQAEPATISDAGHLAKVYCPDLVIGTDLLTALHEKCNGSVRRMVSGFSTIRQQARTNALKTIHAADFKGEFFPFDRSDRRPK